MAPLGDAPLLSVLIATLAKREALFLDLVGGLCKQVEASDAPIEIVALQNQGEHPVAEYRERLLRDARGEFLCFIDDDDTIPDYYVAEIVAALTEHPDADVLTWLQAGTGTAANVTMFGLAFRHAPWHPVAVEFQSGDMPPIQTLAYLRAYSHMQPIRAEIAKQGSFLAEGGKGFTEEDQHFAWSVVPLLLERGSREAYIDKIMYTYRWNPDDTTQKGLQPAARDADHPRPVIASPCFRWCGQ